MNLIERVKNILMKPKVEWEVINSESATLPSLATGYVLPLAGLSAVASFVGYGLIGVTVFGVKIAGINYGIRQALIILTSALLSFFITTYVVDALAPKFKSEKDLNKSAQLVAYSATASYVGGLLSILPAISWLGALFGLYGIYLIYVGLPVLKKTPDEQRVPYMVVTILVLIVVYAILGALLGLLFSPLLGISNPAGFGFGM